MTNAPPVISTSGAFVCVPPVGYSNGTCVASSRTTR
jgi:hypothetical protein